MIARTDRSTSASVVRQLDTEMRISRWPCQVVEPIQHWPERNLSSQMRHQAACVVCGGWSSWGLVAGGSLIHAWAGIWRGRGRRWNRLGWAR